MPGLGLQLATLGDRLAALPKLEMDQLTELPDRWALDTPNAIFSGVVYSMLSSGLAKAFSWCRYGYHRRRRQDITYLPKRAFS